MIKPFRTINHNGVNLYLTADSNEYGTVYYVTWDGMEYPEHPTNGYAYAGDQGRLLRRNIGGYYDEAFDSEIEAGMIKAYESAIAPRPVVDDGIDYTEENY